MRMAVNHDNKRPVNHYRPLVCVWLLGLKPFALLKPSVYRQSTVFGVIGQTFVARHARVHHRIGNNGVTFAVTFAHPSALHLAQMGFACAGLLFHQGLVALVQQGIKMLFPLLVTPLAVLCVLGFFFTLRVVLRHGKRAEQQGKGGTQSGEEGFHVETLLC